MQVMKQIDFFQLLVCSAAFNPRDPFHNFNVEKLMELEKDVDLIYKR